MHDFDTFQRARYKSMSTAEFRKVWLEELEEIGRRIEDFKQQVETIKNSPKPTKFAPFVEDAIEDSKHISTNEKLSKKHLNTKLGRTKDRL